MDISFLQLPSHILLPMGLVSNNIGATLSLHDIVTLFLELNLNLCNINKIFMIMSVLYKVASVASSLTQAKVNIMVTDCHIAILS